MNVISFSLFGDKDKYNTGILRNVELAKQIYPGWEIIIFHDNSTPKNILTQLAGKAELFNISGMNSLPAMPGMMWRFFINDFRFIERFIIRDADSRILLREKEAVDEWIKSGKRLHVMRDHPHHTQKIFGGMWGMVADHRFSFIDEISAYVKPKTAGVALRMIDMDFLREVVYDRYKKDMLVHQSIDYMLNEDCVKPFPSEMKDYRFVGEIINADESREYQYALWKDLKEKRS